jgi:hypothetical protein
MTAKELAADTSLHRAPEDALTGLPQIAMTALPQIAMLLLPQIPMLLRRVHGRKEEATQVGDACHPRGLRRGSHHRRCPDARGTGSPQAVPYSRVAATPDKALRGREQLVRDWRYPRPRCEPGSVTSST